VPPEAPPLAAARRAGVLVVGEIEVALHFLGDTRYIAVTGTNGKTTTTALIGHLLRALGLRAVDAGNIGLPLSEVALMADRPAWVALELSSFQLHDTPTLDPTVGVVTNLSPDHLDRYPGVDAYYADKARMFANAHGDSRWVLNADDAEVLSLHTRLGEDAAMSSVRPGTTYTFSLASSAADAHYERHADVLSVLGEPLLPRRAFAPLGDHNVANALAAALAVMTADAAHQTGEARTRIAEGLRTFHSLAHRLEPVGTFGGVEWINDSKATNVSSTRVALEGMRKPYVLLLGGRHKGEAYTTLAEPFRRHGRTVLAYGEAAPIIEQDLGGLVHVERLGSSFDEVVARARALAEEGGAVLLSPACSSFDMFKNYEERGAEFRRLAAAAEER
jgi:UDP-N-acetylmuramoylalanine--D-glutamate ligase